MIFKNKSDFLIQNQTWIMYSILIDHPSITLMNIYEIISGPVKNITFKDYYALLTLKSCINALVNNSEYRDIEEWINNKDCFSKHEIALIYIFMDNWINKSEVIHASQDNIEAARDRRISYYQYVDKLSFRGNN